MKSLSQYLALATVAHGHLCAGQVLGVRLAMLGMKELGIDDPVADRKRLVTFVEIDRCVTDAVALVASCRLGKRALKFRDWGKVAATFCDLQTGRAVRIAAKESSKQAARELFPELPKEEGQQKAYAQLSDDVLFTKEWVKVEIGPEDLPGFKGPRIVCAECGEGINFKREVIRNGRILCRSCAGERYYTPLLCIAVAFFSIPFSPLARAGQTVYNEHPPECARYHQIQIPATDLPNAEDRSVLAMCDSYNLYFGFDGPADPAKARKCAYLQRDDPNRSLGDPFTGSGLLTMIYINGNDVARNFDLALKFACEIDGAPAENRARFEHLVELQRENWQGTNFSLCDDITSGYMGGWCARLQSDCAEVRQSGELDNLTGHWSLAEKQSFVELRRAAGRFFQDSSANEVDLSGSARSAFEIEAEDRLKRDFLASLQRFESSQLPDFIATQFQQADTELNSTYSQIQSLPEQGIHSTTVTPGGIKMAQRPGSITGTLG